MNCLNFKVRSNNYNKYFYCKLKRKKITSQVKLDVFLRDEGKCVICGNARNVMPTEE